jgi:hypothetical protein
MCFAISFAIVFLYDITQQFVARLHFVRSLTACHLSSHEVRYVRMSSTASLRVICSVRENRRVGGDFTGRQYTPMTPIVNGIGGQTVKENIPHRMLPNKRLGVFSVA